MTDRYAVVGNPIAHSSSPFIHQTFADLTQQDLSYDKMFVELGGFADAAGQFFAGGAKGLNITMPFKLDALAFADRVSARAELAGAANTLIVEKEGAILADNTDGVGLVGDICNRLAWAVSGVNVLILGAGGAVRGVLGPLLAENPSRVLIANRTESKAAELASVFTDFGSVEACGLGGLASEASFDLIINASGAGLAGAGPDIPATVVGPTTRCYDMVYSASTTAFVAWAQQNGCREASDGLGMLVGQAAESFYLRRGVHPPQQSVLLALREKLQQSL